MTADLRQQLQDDLKTAMKAQDVIARETIRYTMSALKYAEIEKGAPLTDAESLALLQREAKRRVDSIEQFRNAGRTDLVDHEEAQMAVLKRYMPEELSESELQALVAAAIAETGASTPKDLGRVMPLLIGRAAGRADGKRLSTAVREALSG